jgi:hypothetical protein
MINCLFQKDFTMKHLTMLTAAAVFFATGLAYGQAPQPSAYEHLKGLEWLVGDKVGQYTVRQGWDEFAPVGTEVTRRVSVRWGLNKSVLQARVTTSIEGKPPITSLEIISWDPKAGQLVHSILSPGGGGGSGVWTQDGDEWQLKWTSVTPSGTTFAGTSRIQETSEDTSVWKVVDATKDGEKIADIPAVKFQKLAAVEVRNLPREYLKLQRVLNGEWTAAGTAEGEKYTAEYRWMPKEHGITYHGVRRGEDSVLSCNGILGWDAAKKQIVFTEYWSVGGFNVLRFGVTPSGVWEGTMAGVNDDGQPTGGQVRLEFKDRNEFTFSATKVFSGEHAELDQQYVFRRR